MLVAVAVVMAGCGAGGAANAIVRFRPRCHGGMRRLSFVCVALVAVLGTVSGSVAAAVPSAVGSPDSVVDARLVGSGVGWVLTQHSLKRTTDDGRTWTNVTPAGLTIHPLADPQQDRTTVYGLGALDARHAFLATESVNNVDFTMTIWRTADGGGTWRRSILRHLVHETGDICGNVCGSDGFGANFDVLSVSVAFMSYGYGSGTDQLNVVVFQTGDGGATWRRVGQWASGSYLQVFFRTTSTMVMSDGYALNATTSGWGKWSSTVLDTPIRPFSASAMTFWNARSWIVGISGGGGLEFAATSDAGHSWLYRQRALPKPDPGQQAGSGQIVAFLDPVTWLATAESCTAAEVCTTWLVRTGDRGHSWRRLGRLPGIEPFTRMVFADRLHGWAGLDGPELYATENGGRTWRRLNP